LQLRSEVGKENELLNTAHLQVLEQLENETAAAEMSIVEVTGNEG
jgi:hypothetical protein